MEYLRKKIGGFTLDTLSCRQANVQTTSETSIAGMNASLDDNVKNVDIQDKKADENATRNISDRPMAAHPRRRKERLEEALRQQKNDQEVIITQMEDAVKNSSFRDRPKAAHPRKNERRMEAQGIAARKPAGVQQRRRKKEKVARRKSPSPTEDIAVGIPGVKLPPMDLSKLTRTAIPSLAAIWDETPLPVNKKQLPDKNVKVKDADGDVMTTKKVSKAHNGCAWVLESQGPVTATRPVTRMEKPELTAEDIKKKIEKKMQKAERNRLWKAIEHDSKFMKKDMHRDQVKDKAEKLKTEKKEKLQKALEIREANALFNQESRRQDKISKQEKKKTADEVKEKAEKLKTEKKEKLQKAIEIREANALFNQERQRQDKISRQEKKKTADEVKEKAEKLKIEKKEKLQKAIDIREANALYNQESHRQDKISKKTSDKISTGKAKRRGKKAAQTAEDEANALFEEELSRLANPDQEIKADQSKKKKKVPSIDSLFDEDLERLLGPDEESKAVQSKKKKKVPSIDSLFDEDLERILGSGKKSKADPPKERETVSSIDSFSDEDLQSILGSDEKSKAVPSKERKTVSSIDSFSDEDLQSILGSDEESNADQSKGNKSVSSIDSFSDEDLPSLTSSDLEYTEYKFKGEEDTESESEEEETVPCKDSVWLKDFHMRHAAEKRFNMALKKVDAIHAEASTSTAEADAEAEKPTALDLIMEDRRRRHQELADLCAESERRALEKEASRKTRNPFKIIYRKLSKCRRMFKKLNCIRHTGATE